MRGTRIEKEVEICATNLANKTKCMSKNTKKWDDGKVQKPSNSVCYTPSSEPFRPIIVSRVAPAPVFLSSISMQQNI
jgi:hypothetical protein